MTLCPRKAGNQISGRKVLPTSQVRLDNEKPCHPRLKSLCQSRGEQAGYQWKRVSACSPRVTGRIGSNLTARNVTHLQNTSIWLPAPNSDNTLSSFQFCAKLSKLHYAFASHIIHLVKGCEGSSIVRGKQNASLGEENVHQEKETATKNPRN